MRTSTHSDEIRHSHLFGKIHITKDNSDHDDNEYGDKTDDDDDGCGGDDGDDDADKSYDDSDDDDERGTMRKLGKTRFAEGGRRDDFPRCCCLLCHGHHEHDDKLGIKTNVGFSSTLTFHP